MNFLHQSFQTQAAEAPEREALVGDGLRWTYGELADRARRLAGTLQRLGVGPEVPVGVCTRRTPGMVAGLLGALEAGGAYLPLDPRYPRERLRFMLEDADAPVVLTDAASAGALPETGARRLFLDRPEVWEGEAGRSAEPDPRGLAYLIYTSGSTGRPKGVAIPHGAAAHLMLWARDAFPPEDLSGVLAATSICFDLSVFEIFAPLSWGGRVILAENALALPALAAAGEVTLVNTVPSAAAELVRNGDFPPSVRTINLAGEALQRSLVDQLYRGTSARAVFNLYGPSEDTTYSTWVRVPREGTSPPTIGVPLPGETGFVLGPDLLPVPDGDEGELYLGGPALARGYLGRPDLTAERFLPDPFSADPGARMYRTGDLVRLRPDGELDFLGRIDHQVKIRGFRIELGEVEAALLAVPGVAECVVVARREETGPRLVAYAAPGDLPVSELRRSLMERLPEYMVPSAFVLLPSLPRTPNGKVDRNALPAPVRVRPEVGSYVAPGREMEERLAAIWAEALGLEAVGVEDDFFELGGHSLIAGRLFSRIRQAFGADVSLRDLFETPTVAGFAARLGPGRTTSPIAGAAGAGESPLSFGQERLLFLQRLEAEPITYNVPILGALAGPLDVEALRRAFTELVRRHEPLRTVFASKDGHEVQVVLLPEEVPVPVLDVIREDADRLALEEFRRPLDLDRGPLMRAVLLRLGPQEHRLLLTVHHIAWDDGSMAVLLRELPALYRGESLPPLPARYADFAAWKRARFQGAELEERLDRWAAQFQDLPQPVELPTDRPRPATPTPRGGEWLFEVAEGPARALRGLARRDGATLFMVSLALFKAWLLRLTGQTDLSVLAPVSTRTRVELEPLVGFFVNNLFVRTDLGGDPTFAELAGRVRDSALGAFEQQELPLDLALRRLHPVSPAAIQALLRVIFALYQEVPTIELAPGLAMTLRETGNGTAKADLVFFLEDRADGRMRVRMEYAADLFEAATVERMGGYFLTLAESVAAGPDRRLYELPVLSQAQRSQILLDWNDTAVAYPREACIHELIEEHVRRAPGALALRFVGGEMTYAELDARADALAAVLVAEGVGPDQLVGLCLERSPEAIVAIVAILKAGGAFAPLDPAYPEDRLAFMLEDTAAPVLITRRGLLERLPATTAKIICWEDLQSLQSLQSPQSFKSLRVSPENLAYVMYTSGSTGRPKGVAVTHRDVVRLARSSRFADFGSDHVFLHMGPLSFDATTLEVGYSLLNGSAMAILPPETPSLQDLGEFLVSQGVTAAWITAGLFQQMVESQLENLSKLRLIMSGGDVLSPAHVARVLEAAPPSPGITMVNGYGPTESTVFTSCHPMHSPAEVGSPLPIGRPIGNTRVAVVDRQLQLAPPGVEGELWIGGDGLARGYLHRPELTAERFVPDPFWGTGDRLYRTGDLVRWRADGLLEFLGRVDFQVKLRGFRIELEEIEAALASHPEVTAAAVVVQGEGGDKRLVAFWSGAESEPDFRSFLGGRLPSYMVPAVFVRLEALPLNAHGKVDRKALARIEPVLGPASPEAEVPRNATEELLAGIWAEVLGLERIGIRDDFFDLGGHSLLILRVLSRVREALGADLVPRDVFDAPTIAGLAERLDSRRIGRLPPVVPVPREGDLPLSYAQHRLWFLERFGTLPGTYNVPVAFRLRGELDVRALQSSLTELARRHETLRTAFPLRDGEPVQAVAAPETVPMPLIDLSGIGVEEAWRLGREEASAPFDLEAGPLLRTRLIRLAPDDHLWLVNLHHIVTDGWSRDVFMREVSRLYAGEPLPELPVQYADYSAWQRQWLESGVLAEQLAWWARKLDGLENLDLPTDRPRPPVQTFRGALRTRRLPASLAEALGPLGRSRGATRFMTLLAAAAALLERYTGRQDLALGTPVANRSRPEIEPLVGFFVNTLVLRVGFENTGSFEDLLSCVRESTLAAYARPDLPFERLVEEIRPERQLGQTPLFQVVFTCEREAGAALDLPGLAVAEMPLETGTAKFDLTLSLSDRPGELALEIEHNADLFDAATIDRLALHFERLLAEAAARPGDALEALPVLDEAERLQLLDRVERQTKARLAQASLAAARDTDWEAPRNAAEETLAGIWGEVLGLEAIGIREDFFEIGGHSLLGTRVMSRVRKAFGIDLPLRTLFERSTIAAIAETLAEARGRDHREEHEEHEEEIPRRTTPADRFPVSFSQLRLWLLDRMEPGTPAYNIPFPLRLNGLLDRRALERSLAGIVRRHEGLRTVFAYESGEPMQVVVPGGELLMPLIDLSGLPDAERDREARRVADRELWRGFDLSRWPLLRASLVRREPERHDLLFVIHHAVADGWSLGMLFAELGALYEAFSADRPSPLPELPIQYPDFAVWQRRRLQGPRLDGLLGYWLGRLSDAGHVLDLPTDRRRPAVLTYRGAHEIARLPRAVVDGLRQREGRGRTTFMLLLAAAEALLSRWSGQDDFCVGTFIANRNRSEIEKLIGFFVNTLVLRADLGALGPGPSFDRLLDQVKEVTLGAYTHQDLPLERLLEALQPKRDPSRTPVFQVMLNLLNLPEPPKRIGGPAGELTMSRLPVDPRRSNFDLTLWFQPDEHALEFDVEYSTDLFDRTTIRRLQDQFARLLEGALAHPETPLDRLSLLGEEEREQLIVEWNRTAAETGADVPVHALFEAQARRVPDKPALVSGDVTLTYAELDRRASSLARVLRRRGVGPETVVGVSLRRSPGMIVALLAVLKAGGAYLPLDPDYPRERLDFMIRDAAVGLVIDDAFLAGARAEGSEGPGGPLPDPSNLAYVIYTSGSTGRPKGVMVTHRSLSNHTASAVAGYGIRESDRVLQFASLSFDTSAEEIYPCFAVGATLVLRDDSMLTSAGQFLAAAERLGITVLNFPTAYWNELASGLDRESAVLPSPVRVVIVGGERMLADRIESWFRSMARQGSEARLMNGYGPTEGTIVATRTAVEPDRLTPSGEPLIGRPIHNVRVYVLDREGGPALLGVPGELYIGGMGVARGYLNRPDLTADRFVPDRFGEPGARLYRTGDRVRWLPGGDLEFVGRVDQQVKIRGFRVEIGEVEEALRRLPGVLDAVVDVRPDPSGTSRLVAWLVPENGVLPGDPRSLAKEHLPAYMVPSAFVPLSAIPKTPSSKIDRRALPEPEPARLEPVAYAEPQSDLERTIVGIWQTVLGVGRVGLHDNFFDLGGHSLLLVQAHGRLREALGRDLDIMILFQRPTVSALVRELSKDEERPSFTQAQDMVRRQRQVNVGRKQLMEKLMQQKKKGR